MTGIPEHLHDIEYEIQSIISKNGGIARFGSYGYETSPPQLFMQSQQSLNQQTPRTGEEFGTRYCHLSTLHSIIDIQCIINWETNNITLRMFCCLSLHEITSKTSGINVSMVLLPTLHW